MFRAATATAAFTALAASAVALQRHRRAGVVPRNAVYLPRGSAPSLPTRTDHLKRLQRETFDVIVVGGGATGSSVALECASRGLACAMLEADDICSGTSSKSTKLLHGGVRYLEMAVKERDFSQLALVCEALAERGHWSMAARHLARPAALLIPLRSWVAVPWVWTGSMVYRLLAVVLGGGHEVPRSRYLTPKQAIARMPLLKEKDLCGAMLYWDSSSNDARLGLSVALTAATPDWIDGKWSPAALGTHCRVVGFLRNDAGQLAGVQVKDEISGNTFEVLGRVVVNAAGPGADQVRRLYNNDAPAMMAPSSGAHVVFPQWLAPRGVGLLINKTTDGRVLFLMPWEGRVLAGTTDESAQFEPCPAATKSDVSWITREAATQLQVPEELLRASITSAWAGLRPLVRVSGDLRHSAKISRSHVVLAEGELVSLMGGKWTTARRMAEDCVSEIVAKNIGGLAQRAPGPVRSRGLKLRGALSRKDRSGAVDLHELRLQLQQQAPLSEEQARYLVHNYGCEAEQVLEIGRSTGTLKPLIEDADFYKPLQTPALVAQANRRTEAVRASGAAERELQREQDKAGANVFLEAEVVYAVRFELAERAVDVIARRLRLSFLDAGVASRVVSRVVQLMAAEKGWNSSRQEREKSLALDYCRRMSV